ncbi:hypothetical protein HanRHA438_Chr04g0176631 [Helianthus annuus]|uniref:Uncharacterized protein n=1 Tax=Helianthus annuus TaxID=4232 RepID=A0A9K3J8K5_HELAN|nr:hypothetical protein HanXRQr2_Chr04g0166961 [Helianthus annuus]KAJ0581094.1 hypothetical protein HanHA300_Chr04g0137011 [Helianthus annuus]KAJ0588902.1 hypothetical protein HanIR_Chr04g0180071 [Helianthus annuus]KAJ0597041.1 hypothetical protein HanHA89_Chr04g0149971 [Helianthus annuus]KAJ0757723.1 hypothetical protein HanLR1_Chr04g0142081 [Helianthus annuus]
MDIVVDDEHSIVRKQFAGLDRLVDIERPAVMKSSNVDGNVVADKFLDGYLYNLTHRSIENAQFEELFAGLLVTTSSIESAKKEDKGFNMEFGALVGCPDKYMSHEMNKVATPNINLVCVYLTF